MEVSVMDRLGNNALVECSECNEPYIVGSPPIYRKPRVCPHCGRTQAIREDDGTLKMELVVVETK